MRCLRCSFRVRCRHRSTVIARWRNGRYRAAFECGNVEASWGSDGRCKRPSGVRGGAPEQKIYMSNWFFITINSMLLYFKHIIHIDDFPLNGHPPTIILCCRLFRQMFVGFQFSPRAPCEYLSCDILPSLPFQFHFSSLS